MAPNDIAPLSREDALLALEDALRALRDLATLDETRPVANRAEKTALRALSRINGTLQARTGVDFRLGAPGHTPRPGEDFLIFREQ